MGQTSQVRLRETSLGPALYGSQSRHRCVRILFIQHAARDVERCLKDLEIVSFKVSADVVLTPKQFTSRLKAAPYDVVVAEYPTANWKRTQALELLQRSGKPIPLIFITNSARRADVAELIAGGAYDCIDQGHIGHLPVSIRRALAEERLRVERDRAEKMLKHSEARYGALIGNPVYGICRCGLDGSFLDVNRALIAMLGYVSREELLSTHLAREVIRDPSARARLLGQPGNQEGIEPLETEWKAKNGMRIRVCLTGREVCAEPEVAESYEVIVQDLTKQRALEERLRELAARDALTGLANYRHFVDVLSAEIKRCERTGREFAVLFFDLNGLKRINDRYGHLVGSKALCRLADALSLCSRDTDTAARFGGDEFALVLPETGASAAEVVARRVCRTLTNDLKEPRLSVSVGIAIYPQDGRGIEQILYTADRALYKMKSENQETRLQVRPPTKLSGRNRDNS